MLRTPLLPRSVLDRWGDGLDVPGATEEALEDAIARDSAKLRAYLRDLVALPEVREAIFVASPALEAGIEGWLAHPTSEAGQKVERSLVRYVSRMAARPTPFGLFAGNTVGTIGDRTVLHLAPRAAYRRYTRLDGDYLAALADRLASDPEVRARLPHRPNTSLARVGCRLRYAMRHESAQRSYVLVSVEPTEYLIATLQRARHGALPDELARALVNPDVTRAEADAYIAELIESQVLVSDLVPPVTGPEAVDDVIAQLGSVDAAPAREAASVLSATRDRLAALDRRLGNDVAEYRAIHEALAPLPVPAKLDRLFQVNLGPAGEVTLGRDLVAEIVRAIDVVRRLARPRPDPLAAFRDAFRARYEDREVPLLEVLDEESGIGFEPSRSPNAEASPLLAGLPFPAAESEPTLPWSPQLAHLAARLAGRDEVELDDADVEALAAPSPAPLPDAFSTQVTLATDPAGGFQLHLDGFSGPSGANVLGRFCHSDPRMLALVREHLAAEEAQRPGVIFAEIVHLADGRLANIAARPVLRERELVFLGRSCAPRDRQLLASDLAVSLVGDRIVLRSVSLDREVVPRLTNAHNFSNQSLGVYRFLASLQYQEARGATISIGALEALPFVPRLRLGRCVLRAARWRLTRAQLAPLHEARTAAARMRAVRSLQHATGLPRWICVEQGDNVLPIDLENVLFVDSFAQIASGDMIVTELWPASDLLPGAMANQLVVAFSRTAEATPPSPRRSRAARSAFLPGSEWLYAKLYTGKAVADVVLTETLAPILAVLPAWFFVRYQDPDWHLRVRVRGQPSWLTGEVLPQLVAAVRPLLDDGRLWRLQLDTYEREVDRYGGPTGIELAERLFGADSACVVDILGMLEGDAGNDARWRLALRGTDQLLDDLGLDLRARHALMTRLRDAFAREHAIERFVPFQRALGDKFRKERAALESLLDRDHDAESELAPALGRLAVRSAALAPIIAELRSCSLAVPVEDLAASYVHMHLNRILRSAQRAHELVIYDYLTRLYDGRLRRR